MLYIDISIILFYLDIEEERKYKNKICYERYSNLKSDPKTIWTMINKLGSNSKNDIKEISNKEEFVIFLKKKKICINILTTFQTMTFTIQFLIN
jgi:hypothetical protein